MSKNKEKNLNENEPKFLFACAMDGVGVNYSEDGIHWETPTSVSPCCLHKGSPKA